MWVVVTFPTTEQAGSVAFRTLEMRWRVIAQRNVST
jgi:hypothetical protein